MDHGYGVAEPLSLQLFCDRQSEVCQSRSHIFFPPSYRGNLGTTAIRLNRANSDRYLVHCSRDWLWLQHLYVIFAGLSA